MPQHKRTASSLTLFLAISLLVGCGGDDTSGREFDVSSAHGNPRQAVEDAAVAGPATSSSAVDAQRDRSRIITHPGYYDIYAVFINWSGRDPELDHVAQRNVESAGANEFEREQSVAREKKRLEAWIAEGRGVGSIKLSLGGRLSEYDPQYGEFYIESFAPGRSVVFNPSSSAPRSSERGYMGLPTFPIEVSFNNSLAAYVWRVSEEEARRIVAEISKYRAVNVEATVDITEAKTGANGSGQLVTNIREFELFADDKRIASFDLSEAAE